MAAQAVSAVPDILAAGLRCVFCGINPGRRSSAAGCHFANPRNDFWRLLADAGLTPRLLDPSEQWDLLGLGYGLTNAAYRTTKGSERPAARRLRRRGGAAGAARRRARARDDRLRRQVLVPGRVRRPAERARPPGADARPDDAVRAPVDVTRKCGRAVRGAAGLVHAARRAPRFVTFLAHLARLP